MNLTEKRKSILLIDGNNIAYRSFFAIPHLATSYSVPTNAIYGFLSMLFHTHQLFHPDYLAICFDSKEKTFRAGDYEVYKAQRKPTPDLLIQQMKLIKDEVLVPLGIGVFEKPGFEADDLIATLSNRFCQENIYVRIFSGDRDMIQLIQEGQVEVVSPVNGSSEMKRYQEKEVKEQYGITPSQMIDYKSLVGDPSDNIPGIPSVGPKTAQKWLEKYGSIEHLLADDSKETAKAREHQAVVVRNQQLIKLWDNVPVSIEIEQLRTKPWNQAVMMAILEKFELKTLMKRFSVFQETTKPVIPEITFQEITSEKLGQAVLNKTKLTLWVENKQYLYMFDGIHRYRISFSEEDLFSTFHPLSWIDSLMKDSQVQKVVFNAKELLHLVKPPEPNQWTHVTDCLLFWYLWKPNAKNYEAVDFIQEFAIQASTMDLVLWEAVDPLTEVITRLGLLPVYQNIELPLLFILYQMEEKGLRVDRPLLGQLRQKLGTLLVELQQTINQMAGAEVNVLSPKQLGSLLFEKLGLPGVKKTKTGFSTDAEVLKELEPLHPVVSKIVSFKEMSKLQNTYVESFLKLSVTDSLLHTTYLQAGPATGRLSSLSPNLQNIPMDSHWGKQLREAIVPKEPNFLFLSADYSQIDLRVMAHFSGDPKLVQAFLDGDDIHDSTARLIFHCQPGETVSDEKRAIAKTINFGVLYGMAPYGLSQALQITEKEAVHFIETYFHTFAGVADWMNQTVKEAEKKGYVTTLLGHRRPIPELSSSNKMIHKLGERLAINTIIQGTSADIIKMAMLQVDKLLVENTIHLILQIHDELIFEVSPSQLDHWCPIIQTTMEHALPLQVPLLVHVSYGKTLAALQ